MNKFRLGIRHFPTWLLYCIYRFYPYILFVNHCNLIFVFVDDFTNIISVHNVIRYVILVKQIHKHLCLLFQRLVTLGFEIGDCTLWIIISIAVKRRLGQIIQKPLMCLFIQLCIIFTINSVSDFSPVQYKNSDRFTCTPGGFPALYSHILFHTAINLTFAFYFSGNPSVRSLRQLCVGFRALLQRASKRL